MIYDISVHLFINHATVYDSRCQTMLLNMMSFCCSDTLNQRVDYNIHSKYNHKKNTTSHYWTLNLMYIKVKHRLNEWTFILLLTIDKHQKYCSRFKSRFAPHIHNIYTITTMYKTNNEYFDCKNHIKDAFISVPKYTYLKYSNEYCNFGV